MTRPVAPSPAMHRVPWRPVALFIVLALAVCWAAALPFLVGPLDPASIGVVVPLVMPVPALASLLVHRWWRRGVLRELWAVRLPRPRVLLVAGIVSMLLIPVTQLAIALALGVTQWEPRAGLLAAVLATPVIVAVQVVLSTGEELGWRGYLSSLMASWSFWPAAMFISLVWVGFHVPATVALWISDAGPLASLLFLADIFVIGLLFEALRRWTRSVWPVVIAHATLNSGRVLIMQNLTTPETELSSVEQIVLHAIGWGLFAVCAAMIARRAEAAR